MYINLWGILLELILNIYDKLVTGDPSEAMKAVAEIAAEPFVAGSLENQHIVEHPAGHMTLKHLIQRDRERIQAGQPGKSQSLTRTHWKLREDEGVIPLWSNWVVRFSEVCWIYMYSITWISEFSWVYKYIQLHGFQMFISDICICVCAVTFLMCNFHKTCNSPK